MQWQDLVLTMGSIVLVIALIPSIVGAHKPAMITSILSGSVLASFAMVYATLNLPITTVVTFVSSALWFTLAAQVYLRNQRTKKTS